MTELEQFTEDLHQQVIASCESEDTEAFREDRFTEYFIDCLLEAGEIDDGIPCFHRAHGIQLSGYGFNSAQDCISLFVTLSKWELPPPRLRKAEVEVLLKRVTTFFERALDGYHFALEEASPVFDAALQIHDLKDALASARFYLFTDGIAEVPTLSSREIGNIEGTYEIWDIERLFRLLSSGKQRETIEIDFTETFGGPLPCLPMLMPNGEYTTYLTIFPAPVLVEVYRKHGPRLLERNVRTFLQLRGNVNKGIRKTILSEPKMFLAYNNGISVTAESVSTECLPAGGIGIVAARDFQIVNGAQTVASLYHASQKEKAGLSDVLVQAKITVLASAERMEEVVPRISEYSNSQNKISVADFSANHPFHLRVEALSRTVWAPASDGSQRQTRWFYERARGQYLDEKVREGTPARQRAFEVMHPSRQCFTKTDLAKFENTWRQLPHCVSLGAQKNFQVFMFHLLERERPEPEQRYFEHLVAKAILFRQTERLVHSQQYGGYRANIVTYTLAWLSHKSQMKVDLDKIWRNQALSPVLSESILAVSKHAHEHITRPPGGKNVTEWCKREECWQQFREREVELSSAFYEELVTVGPGASNDSFAGIDRLTPQDKKRIDRVMSIPAETWLALSSWAKQTNNLEGWQRGLVYSIGKRYVEKGKEPSRKQAFQALSVFDEATRLGFEPGAGT